MDRKQAIESSLEIAAERGGDLVPLVYARLFAARPELEAMFCMDRDGAVRGSMLNHALEVALDLAGDRTYAESFVRSETVNHGSTHGVDIELFAVFYDHLTATVRELAGGGWTAAMETAWCETIDEVRRLSTAV